MLLGTKKLLWVSPTHLMNYLVILKVRVPLANASPALDILKVPMSGRVTRLLRNRLV